MLKENIEQPSAEKKEGGTAYVEVGSVTHGVGAASNAVNKLGEDMKTVSETGKNGDVEATLKGNKFGRLVRELVLAGNTNIVLNMSREQELSDGDVAELLKLRSFLKTKNVTLELIGVEADTKEKLRQAHVLQEGTEAHTNTMVGNTLVEKAKKTEAPKAEKEEDVLDTAA